MDSVELLEAEKQTKLGSKVGKALKAVQAAAAIASFVFTFFITSEPDVMHHELDKRMPQRSECQA